MIEVTNRIQRLQILYRNHGAQLQSVNIIGLRDESNMHKDIYNDFIIAFDSKEAYMFNATTDPSVYYTQNPMDGVGCAHLCYGYYRNAYMIGIHAKGKPYQHEALVQRGNKVKIWRDVNKNFVQDATEPIEEGYFGINIHKNLSTLNLIQYSSAGCQVIQHVNDFEYFINFVKLHAQKFYSYLLCNIREVDFV